MRHSLSVTFALMCCTTLACGPTITPLPPRGPLPAAVDAPDGPDVSVSVRARSATAELNSAEARYFEENPLMVPVRGVAPSALRDSFNDRRSGGRMHRALDIPARRGTPVLAAMDGTVLSMRQNTLGGTTLYLVDAQRKFVYYYAHLERYHDRITEGVEVRQGDIVGYVGTSGNAPQNFPHLHFQALRVDPDRRDWWNGPPIDVRAQFRLAGGERAL